jgi:hypothetical protein
MYLHTLYFFTKDYNSDQIKEDEMGEACNTYER